MEFVPSYHHPESTEGARPAGEEATMLKSLYVKAATTTGSLVVLAAVVGAGLKWT